jgi:flagellum-specific peptidoglycan hydrolase FlgJ
VTVEEWVRTMAPWAEEASRLTGGRLLVPVILAQWALETGWGTSKLFVDGHNVAGVKNGGAFRVYPTLAAGVQDYAMVFLRFEWYSPVLEAGAEGPEAQARALAASPWDAGHYGDPPGADLLPVLAEVEAAMKAAGGAETSAEEALADLKRAEETISLAESYFRWEVTGGAGPVA